jgi:3,4-dihydroxy 2-butanone 4-phosphate synthase/GTP cyclohydrolase II
MDSIHEVVADIRAGKMVIVVDDEDRENEGDLVMAAEKVTPEAVAFIITHGRGLLCAPITGEQAARLNLAPMVEQNTEYMGTAFTVSVDHISTTTGISAFDRAATIRALADPAARAEDFRRPGHLFPLLAKPGGVLERRGQTEAVIDLTKLAGLSPAGVLCEIIRDDGHMARRPELEVFAARHQLKLISVAQIVEYRRQEIGDSEQL